MSWRVLRRQNTRPASTEGEHNSSRWLHEVAPLLMLDLRFVVFRYQLCENYFSEKNPRWFHEVPPPGGGGHLV